MDQSHWIFGIKLTCDQPHLHPHVCVPAVVPEEVKPKFVKGTKRYGRRSHPDDKPTAALSHDLEDSPPSRTEAADSSPAGLRRAKLRRSTSLESVEVSGHMFTSVSPCGFFFFCPVVVETQMVQLGGSV